MNPTDLLLQKLSLDKNDGAISFNAATLAYIGDAVFEIMVRQMVVLNNNMNINKLNNISKSYVKASSQSKMVQYISPMLTENESKIYKRGRNTNTHSVAKNAEIIDYRRATGLETLFGYLFISGQIERVNELFLKCVECINKDKIPI